jgi:hypothetical protein
MRNMEKHLTEQELIEYQFKLAPDTDRGRDALDAIAGHLESCAQCREQLEKLKRKFAALDLLREKTEVSEELISQVIEQAKKSAPAKIFFLRKPVWAGIAAVLLLGLVLITNTSKERKKTEDVLKLETTPMQLAEKPKSTQTVKLDGTNAPRTMLAKDNRQQTGNAAYFLHDETKAEAAEEIPEQPPFAPASAIELVTLPRRDNVQLTIYNSADLTLVRERRNLTMKKGWNWLQFMWANTLIDPTSLSLEPLEQKDKIDIQQLVFPARLRELGRWLIHSQVSGQVPFELTYLTSGLSWRAFYMGTLSQDEKSMQLKGYVRVTNNSGEDYENAQTRLVVGQVHLLDQIADLARRQFPYGSPIPERMAGGYGGMGGFDKKIELSFRGEVTNLAFDALSLTKPKEIAKEGLSEYFLYTIEGTETIPNGWGKRLLSFEAHNIDVESLYKYDEGRYGNQTIRFVKFANDKDHNLGETPIPNGNVKIYGVADEQGYLSYVGGTDIKYIPVNEQVELNLGQARLVEVKPTLMDFKTENYLFDPNENIIGWDEIRSWKIEITNTRQIPITIEIIRDFGTSFWTLQCETPYEKYDVTRARFNLTIEPRTKRTLEYTVTTYQGTRQDVLNQKQE